MKNMIIIEKVNENKRLSEDITNTIMPPEVAQALSFVDLARRYMQTMSNVNLNTAKELRLTSINKYWKRAGQIELELDGLDY